jgi:hypothetical protein
MDLGKWLNRLFTSAHRRRILYGVSAEWRQIPRGRMPIRLSTPATPTSQSSASSIPIAVNPI